MNNDCRESHNASANASNRARFLVGESMKDWRPFASAIDASLAGNLRAHSPRQILHLELAETQYTAV